MVRLAGSPFAPCYRAIVYGLVTGARLGIPCQARASEQSTCEVRDNDAAKVRCERVADECANFSASMSDS